MSGIFISYRRDDTAYIAGRLYDSLVATFGPDLVFRDIHSIGLGTDFVARLESAVASSDALVVLIGDTWLTVQDAAGRRRLDDPKDWVRIEIAKALRQGILVVPVLVENAKMPAKADLPTPLRRLTRMNALTLTDLRWEYDLEQLTKALRTVVQPAAEGVESQRSAPDGERAHLTKLLDAHRRNLQIYEEQAARFGPLAPVHILTSLEEERAAVTELRQRLGLTDEG